MSLEVSSKEAPRLLISQPADSSTLWGPGVGLLPKPAGIIPEFCGLPCGKVLMPACAREESIYHFSDCRGHGGDLSYSSGFCESLPTCIWQNIRQQRE